jgi:hypothetical protein
MLKSMLAGLVLCAAFAVVPTGAPRADALAIGTPTAKGMSCTAEKKCIPDCVCRDGCSVTCAPGEIAKCVAAHQESGLCVDAKCSCRKQPKASGGDVDTNSAGLGD